MPAILILTDATTFTHGRRMEAESLWSSHQYQSSLIYSSCSSSSSSSSVHIRTPFCMQLACPTDNQTGGLTLRACIVGVSTILRTGSGRNVKFASGLSEKQQRVAVGPRNAQFMSVRQVSLRPLLLLLL